MALAAANSTGQGRDAAAAARGALPQGVGRHITTIGTPVDVKTADSGRKASTCHERHHDHTAPVRPARRREVHHPDPELKECGCITAAPRAAEDAYIFLELYGNITGKGSRSNLTHLTTVMRIDGKFSGVVLPKHAMVELWVPVPKQAQTDELIANTTVTRTCACGTSPTA